MACGLALIGQVTSILVSVSHPYDLVLSPVPKYKSSWSFSRFQITGRPAIFHRFQTTLPSHACISSLAPEAGRARLRRQLNHTARPSRLPSCSTSRARRTPLRTTCSTSLARCVSLLAAAPLLLLSCLFSFRVLLHCLLGLLPLRCSLIIPCCCLLLAAME